MLPDPPTPRALSMFQNKEADTRIRRPLFHRFHHQIYSMLPPSTQSCSSSSSSSSFSLVSVGKPANHIQKELRSATCVGMCSSQKVPARQPNKKRCNRKKNNAKTSSKTLKASSPYARFGTLPGSSCLCVQTPSIRSGVPLLVS